MLRQLCRLDSHCISRFTAGVQNLVFSRSTIVFVDPEVHLGPVKEA
jgi:hypothetical protein